MVPGHRAPVPRTKAPSLARRRAAQAWVQSAFTGRPPLRLSLPPSLRPSFPPSLRHPSSALRHRATAGRNPDNFPDAVAGEFTLFPSRDRGGLLQKKPQGLAPATTSYRKWRGERIWHFDCILPAAPPGLRLGERSHPKSNPPPALNPPPAHPALPSHEPPLFPSHPGLRQRLRLAAPSRRADHQLHGNRRQCGRDRLRKPRRLVRVDSSWWRS